MMPAGEATILGIGHSTAMRWGLRSKNIFAEHAEIVSHTITKHGMITSW